MSVFISYAREDEAVAEELATLLKMKGDQVFYDQASLPPTADFSTSIQTAIAKSDRLIFLISPHSLEEDSYAQFELRQAKQRWENPSGRVLPVLLDDTLPIGNVDPYLRLIQMVAPKANIAHQVAHDIDRTRTTGLFCRSVIFAVLAGAFLYGGSFVYDRVALRQPEVAFLSLGQVGHYVGSPNIILPVRMQNSSTKLLNLGNFTARLVGPENAQDDVRTERDVHLEGVVVKQQMPGGMAQAVDNRFVQFVLEPNTTSSYDLSFLHLDASQGMRLHQAVRKAMEKPENRDPNVQWTPTRIILSPDATDDFVKSATERLVWKPGRWKLSLRFRANDEVRTKNIAFDITLAQIKRMKDVFPFYDSGAGIFPGWRFAGPQTQSDVKLDFPDEKPKPTWAAWFNKILGGLSNN